jgi:xanthine dehydrogenase accessory factor
MRIKRQARIQPGANAFAVVLGTNEIASATAVSLHRAGYFTVLSHDPFPPVIRRKMAFHDALFDDPVTLNGVTAQRADTGLEIVTLRQKADWVIITELGLLDLLIVQIPSVLVDARMHKYQVTPDLRRLAKFTLGLGPSFEAGRNCDFAIETQPAKSGEILHHGATAKADGVAPLLGDRGAERFVRSAFPGTWRTPIEIGTRVFKDYTIGFLGSTPVAAPFDGILRGVVRDGTEVPVDIKLLELDPRGRGAVWSGIDIRAERLAKAVMHALAIHRQTTLAKAKSALHLVK